MCMGIQERSLGNTLLEVKSAKVLRAEIVKCLTSASDDKILNAKLDEILKLVKMSPSSQVPKSGYQEIMGGDKNQDRELNIPHFKLYNGCWFDFAITIDETTRHAQIIAFDFEIRFPKREDEIAVPFLRIDLNLPDHNNDERNIRFHLHPSHDDIMIHSPPMSPLEILHMFLYGIKIPDKLRSS
ncbi:MAG: hypothetical protein DCF19_08990 [Pseudanabaena frigida]|uniref:Uncharacterized protein n=1 Tax=Pseudanabaena frigida TaxID=945775 RepID=A0A2W4WET3_9CYAN|nr:MAG: hypothetical protein DCF19_08990 [Pseudanabaena frigida]